MIVNVCVAIAIVPARGVPVFASTLKLTAPLPLPEAPDVTVIHGTPLTAVHAHAAVVVTVTVPVLTVAGAL